MHHKTAVFFLIVLSFAFIGLLAYPYFFENTANFELITFGFSTLIALISFGWAIFNKKQIREVEITSDKKRMIFKSYDENVSSLIKKALDILDDLIEEIDENISDKSTDSYKPVGIAISKAYIYCDEANQYMKKQGFITNFGAKFYSADGKGLDDFFIKLVQEIEGNIKNTAFVEVKLKEAKNKLIETKVEMRSEVVENSEKYTNASLIKK